MRRTAAVLAAATIAMLSPFVACSDGDRAAGTDDADVSTDAVAERPRVDAFVPEDSGPTFNSDGWVRVEFDPSCEFYAAPGPDKMPSPIEWEPCSAAAQSLGFVCKQIKFTWPSSDLGVQMAHSPSARVDEKGKAWLVTSRFFGKTVLKFVAEADGLVHQAITHQDGRCNLTRASLSDGKVTWTALRQGLDGKDERRGALGGPVDEVPLALESWSDGIGRGYVAGPNEYFAVGPESAVRPYVPGAAPLGTVVVTDPGQMGAIQFVGDELFFQVTTLAYSRIKVYSAAAGSRDLVSFGNDVSANAADFGTDGVDMVWTEAFGRTSSSDPWTTINIMTSKFTSDSAKIVKRRLRSESGSLGAVPFKVGCGYAAHDVSGSGVGTRLVRLSDGRSWRLTEARIDGGPAWAFLGPLAITCDELFINVNDGKENRVARIRIDSLGEGEAAD